MGVARRAAQHEAHVPDPSGAPSSLWEARLEVIIAIALGLAAVVTAGAVYLNEHQEHKATIDFHNATHDLVTASIVGIHTPRGKAFAEAAETQSDRAQDHQEKAADYTLAEVILATSLFLFGVAGISSRWRIKVGALGVATGIFLIAVIVLATV
jgi:Flp pilus assembly protein TadB